MALLRNFMGAFSMRRMTERGAHDSVKVNAPEGTFEGGTS